jgi:hypothetical protein
MLRNRANRSPKGPTLELLPDSLASETEVVRAKASSIGLATNKTFWEDRLQLARYGLQRWPKAQLQLLGTLMMPQERKKNPPEWAVLCALLQLIDRTGRTDSHRQLRPRYDAGRSELDGFGHELVVQQLT